MIWKIKSEKSLPGPGLIGEVEWKLPEDIAKLFENYPPQIIQGVKEQFSQIFLYFLNSLTLVMSAPDFTWAVLEPELMRALLSYQKLVYSTFEKIYDGKEVKEGFRRDIAEINDLLKKFEAPKIKLVMFPNSPFIGKNLAVIAGEFNLGTEGSKSYGENISVGDELIFSGSPENLLYFLKKQLSSQANLN